MKFKSHDHALRIGPFDAAEPQILEHRLSTEERICGLPIGPSQRPAFDRDGTLAAGQFDRGTHERIGDPLTSVPDPDEQARQEPHARILIARPTTHDLASSARGAGVPRTRTAGAPTDRLASH